jgi:hypothetical protein
MLKQLHTPPVPVLLEDLGTKLPTEKSNYKKRYGLYKCYCGSKFEASTADIKSEKIKSCGCFRILKCKIIHTTHGLRKHPLYLTWNNIIQRTTNITDPHYAEYGGRGIGIADRWLSIENFIDDVYPSYKIGLTIDRIDNDGDYEPSNYRWADKFTQAQNTRLLRTTNKSGYRGVYWNKAMNKWKSQISFSKKSICIGYFSTAIDAAKAYDKYVLDNNLEHTINNVKLG